MAGVSPQDGQPLTQTPSRAYRVGRIKFTTEGHNVGLSAEVCESFVRDCINVKQLHRLAAAIEKRIEQLVAKDSAKAAKRAKATKK
jgi:hypothetical protein